MDSALRDMSPFVGFSLGTHNISHLAFADDVILWPLPEKVCNPIWMHLFRPLAYLALRFQKPNHILLLL